MSTVLDMVQSALFAGTILLLVLQMGSILGDVNSGQVIGIGMQEWVDDLGRIVEYDLSKIGYGVPSGMPAIMSADTLGNIRFRANVLGSTSWVDSVRYSVEATGSGNLSRLIRTVNDGVAMTLAPAFDSLSVRYYDGRGNELSSSCLNTQAGRDSIRSFSVRIHVAENQDYASGFTLGANIPNDINGYSRLASSWECTISPRNLQIAK